MTTTYPPSKEENEAPVAMEKFAIGNGMNLLPDYPETQPNQL